MGSILAIDYGTKRVGLAISDSLRSFAFPLDVIENKGIKNLLSQIENIVNEKEIDLIIVGMPYGQRLKEKSKMELLVREFVENLKVAVSVPIEVVDERLSSFAALENLKESGISSKRSKMIIDKEAARLLLQEYLETNQKTKN